jgi:hypothetical protein
MVAGLAFLVVPPTEAAIVTYNFADPGADAPSSAFVLCDGSGQDRCGTTLDFTKDGLTVTASVAVGDSEDSGIIQDLHPDRGGLGIVDEFEPGDHEGNDNVSEDETILLTFDVPVFLHTVSFFDDHETLPHSFPDGSNFLFSVDGSPFVDVPLGGCATPCSIDFGGVLGTAFAFQHAGQDKDDFYIAGLTADPTPPVPEPGTLLLLGSGVLGLASRFRRRQRAARPRP